MGGCNASQHNRCCSRRLGAAHAPQTPLALDLCGALQSALPQGQGLCGTQVGCTQWRGGPRRPRGCRPHAAAARVAPANHSLSPNCSPPPPPTHTLTHSCSQWSWPINLPVQFFGIFPAGVLRDGDASAPWADEIEQKVFQASVVSTRRATAPACAAAPPSPPAPASHAAGSAGGGAAGLAGTHRLAAEAAPLLRPTQGIGPYIEVAFYHKPSRTLLVSWAPQVQHRASRGPRHPCPCPRPPAAQPCIAPAATPTPRPCPPARPPAPRRQGDRCGGQRAPRCPGAGAPGRPGGRGGLQLLHPRAQRAGGARVGATQGLAQGKGKESERAGSLEAAVGGQGGGLCWAEGPLRWPSPLPPPHLPNRLTCP